MISQDPILMLRDVCKDYRAPDTGLDEIHALRHVNLTVHQGDFVGITGPSGSGKTTLLNIVGLMDIPSTGQVLLGGRSIDGLNSKALAKFRGAEIGMVFQGGHLLAGRTVEENVRFRFRYLDTDSMTARKRTEDILHFLGIDRLANRPIRLLSGGEKQRVAIARAVVAEPRILLADEPTGNLDGAAEDKIMETFNCLNKTGITILMVTHNKKLLAPCTRIMSCVSGRVESSVE